MADKREAEDEEFPKDDEESPPTDKIQRPISGKSGGSTESKKSMPGTVTQLTAKALREFRLSDDGAVSESEDGARVNSAAIGATADLGGPAEGQTLLEQSEEYEPSEADDDDEVGFVESRDIEEEEIDHDAYELESSGEEEDSDGENDLVVLDPDHVRK